MNLAPWFMSRPLRLHGVAGVRFLLATGVVFVLNVGLTVGLHEVAGVPAEVAFGTALVIVFVVTFMLLRGYVYRGHVGRWWTQFLRYAPAAVAFRAIEYSVFLVAHTWFGLDYRFAVVIILTASAVTKFLYYRVVVFRPAGAASA